MIVGEDIWLCVCERDFAEGGEFGYFVSYFFICKCICRGVERGKSLTTV